MERLGFAYDHELWLHGEPFALYVRRAEYANGTFAQ